QLARSPARSRYFLAPKSCRGNVGALTDRGKLQPDHGLDHPFALGESTEAAVGRSDHTLAFTDRAYRLLDTARHHLRMLDEVAGGFHHARDQQHVFRQWIFL